MLTRIQVRNLKRFDDVTFELGKTVVLIGPNNSGKTTELQALALWEIGLRRWNEKRLPSSFGWPRRNRVVARALSSVVGLRSARII